MAGFIQIRRTGHFHWRNEAESGSLALRLMRSPCKASPTRITPRQRSLGYFDERVISKISSFQLTRSARLRLAHRITRIRRQNKAFLLFNPRNPRNPRPNPYSTSLKLHF